MSEMIERVAKAIEAEIDTVETVMADPLTLRRLGATRIARAAIKAMRSPTTEMKTAGGLACGNRDLFHDGYVRAIDAALSPSPKGKGEEG